MPHYLCAHSNTVEVMVQNRILATVQGKTFSVLDVMKHMNLFLSQNYPQYLDIPEAKIQFYKSQWKTTLQHMIDNHLMVMDAQARQIETGDAEIREEIHRRYGSHVVQTLDKLGVSYEEAKEAIRKELTVQKIQWVRISSKVLPKVTTEMTKTAYADYLRHNPPEETWAYQFLTVRYDSTDMAFSLAQQIKALQNSSESSLPVAMDIFKQKLPEAEWQQLSLSSDIQIDNKDLAESHRLILTALSKDVWSAPIIQKTRDGKSVVRIFHLKDHSKKEAPSFEAVSHRIKDYLLSQFAEAETHLYLAKLYQRFNYDHSQIDAPANFEPFFL